MKHPIPAQLRALVQGLEKNPRYLLEYSESLTAAKLPIGPGSYIQPVATNWEWKAHRWPGWRLE